jgi:hypothetical protein
MRDFENSKFAGTERSRQKTIRGGGGYGIFNSFYGSS